MAGLDRIGTELAGYRLLEIIGRGGASVVYLAEHLRLGRRAALKVLAPQLAHDEGFRERFIRESRTAAGLDHPNIVPVYDAGEADGVLYLAMRYVQGSDLGEVIRSTGPIEAWRTLAIVAQVAAGLDVAHDEGLVHRDVKPGNVLLTRDRSTGMERAFLSDFGLTKRIASSGGGLTQTGQFVGTVDYVAPEQILGEPVDGRTDVYSLGCVLFHCLRGAPPFARPNDVGTIYAHVHAPAPALTTDGSRRIDAVIARALAKDRNDRYGTCSDLVEAARSAIQADPAPLGEMIDASETPVHEPARTEEPTTAVVTREATTVARLPAQKHRRRRAGVVWIGAAAILALAVALVANVLAAPGDRLGPSPSASAPVPTSSTSPDPARGAEGPEYAWLRQGHWQVRPVQGENEIMNAAIATADGGLLGVGHGDPSLTEEDAAVWLSPNGRRWRRVDTEPLRAAGAQRMVDVAAFGDGYVAIGYSGDDAAVWATEDGVRGWGLVEVIPDSGLQVMRKIVPIDGGLLVVGRNEVGGETDAASWVSTDGISWERVSDDALQGPGEQAMWTAVEIDGAVFGLGESADGFGATDAAVWRLDDEGWTSIDARLAAPGQQEMREVAVAGDGTVVAVGIDGETGATDAAIWTSSAPALTEWETADGRFDMPGDQQLLGIVATDRGFVAMGWTGLTEGSHDALVWTSPNGSNWRRPRASSTPMVQLGGPGNQEVRAIAEFGRLLVAVGVSAGDEENAGLWIGTPTD